MMDQSDRHLLRPPWLHIARLAWLALISTSVFMFILALPLRVNQLLADPFGMRPGLAELGLTIEQFVYYDMLLSILVALGFIGFALLLFIKASREWIVLLCSLAIGMLIILFFPITGVLPEVNPAWQAPYLFLRMVGFAGLFCALLLFPDGRIAPRWVGFGLLIILVYPMLWLIYPALAPVSTLIFKERPDAGGFILVASIIALVMFIQIYRYRYTLTPTQRQQTRWVVFGLVFAMIGLLLLALPGIFWKPVQTSSRALSMYLLVGIPVAFFSMLLFPLSIAISIFRYRLWDIDLIIRKTLVYSLLTGLLGLLFLGLITALQSLFSSISRQQSALSIVLTTLAIAALFNPLRRRIQDFIDRRFFRRKYDAEKALAEFAAAARSETDLAQLTSQLITTVQETLQPQKTSLWLIAALTKHPGTTREQPL